MASRWLFLPALAAALLGAWLCWRWLGAPVALPDGPSRLACLSYTPTGPGRLGATTPGWVSRERIEADVALLARYTGCLRLYSPLGTSPDVVAAAQARGLRVMLGAWIGRDDEQNGKEIRAALALARSYPATVSALVVGNEVLLRREMSPAQLAALIRAVRAESPVPVAYGDVAHFIGDNPEIVEAADLLLIHLLPYWDDPAPPPADEAADLVLRVYADFRADHPGKEVMIGETGWPSRGRMRGPARPGVIEEARFVREFAARAEALGIRYNLIEAIDQPWKRAHEGTVGGYWGILDEARAPKFALAGPVSGWPGWRQQLALTAIAILIALLYAWRSRPTAVGWAGWSALSLAAGIALAWQWDYAMATARSVADWITAASFAGLSLAAIALLARPLAGTPGIPGATLADLAHALTAPRTLLASAPLRRAAFCALTLVPAAWTSLVLAIDPRHRDVPLARFALPALAVACLLRGRAGEDRREEAVLAAILVTCGLAQLEWANEETLGWLAVSLLLAWPWRGALRAELARVGRLVHDAWQPEQRREHA